MRRILAPLSRTFSELTKLRIKLYRKGFFESVSLDAPVISIGNLTVGGTGKTPMVDVLLTQLEKAGKKTCVLTRGYGRFSDDIIVLDNNSITKIAGDEPVWLASRHPKSVIAVGANRIKASKAVSKPDVFLLDDGFQHLKIKRDLDIVLVDCTRPLWHYKPLPEGYGRESFTAIGRAQMVILTRSNQASLESVALMEKTIRSYGVTHIIRSQLRVKSVTDIWSGKEYAFRQRKVCLMSGIANPQSFEILAKSAGAQILFHRKKSDHFHYTEQNVTDVLKKAKKEGADLLVVTEKDAIKIREFSNIEKLIPLTQLEVALEFEPKLPEVYELAIDSFY